MSVGNVGEIKETVKLKKTYTRVRTEKEAEIEKRIAANIESLGIMKGYSVSKLQEKLGLNNKDFKGFRDGTKAGLRFTTIVAAGELFGVSWEDIINHDYEADRLRFESYEKRISEIEGKYAEFEKNFNSGVTKVMSSLMIGGKNK